MYNRLIISAILGLLYLSCRDQNQVTSSDSDIPPSESVETTASSDVATETLDAQLNTSGLEWSPVRQDLSASTGSKLYLVDIYTEWCGYCKLMDKKTFADPGIQDLLSDNFRLLKMDAESKDSISFRDKRYGWRPDGKKGINELAAELMEGKIAYPTLVFLNENLETIRISQGYKNPAQLKQEIEMALRS